MTAVSFYSTPWTGPSSTLESVLSWSKGTHDALLAVGLLETADSGQVNFNALTVMPAAGSTIGYKVYALGDALQSTAPLYVKFTWRRGASAGYPIVDSEFGTGTTGTGVITGAFATSSATATSSTSGSGTQANTLSFVCFSNGVLTMSLFPDGFTLATPITFHLERSREYLSGAEVPTARGYFYMERSSPANMVAYRYGVATGNLHRDQLRIPAFAATTPVGSGVTAVFPMLPVFPPGDVPPWQPLGVIAVSPSDRPGAPFEVSLNGVTRTYVAPAMPATVCPTVYGPGTSVANAAAILWDSRP